MKIKHIEILECVESRTLFKILGRHRAIRELNKGKLSLIPHRNATGERSIMYNVYWEGSKQGDRFWSKLFMLHLNNTDVTYNKYEKAYLRAGLLRVIK